MTGFYDKIVAIILAPFVVIAVIIYCIGLIIRYQTTDRAKEFLDWLLPDEVPQ